MEVSERVIVDGTNVFQIPSNGDAVVAPTIVGRLATPNHLHIDLFDVGHVVGQYLYVLVVGKHIGIIRGVDLGGDLDPFLVDKMVDVDSFPPASAVVYIPFTQKPTHPQ